MKKADFLQNFKLLKHRQDCRCIYFLFRDEELVYVGITDNIDLRVKRHKHLKKGSWDSCYYMSLPFDTAAENGISHAIEKALIKHFKPELNSDFKDSRLDYAEVWLLRQIFGDIKIEF